MESVTDAKGGGVESVTVVKGIRLESSSLLQERRLRWNGVGEVLGRALWAEARGKDGKKRSERLEKK